MLKKLVLLRARLMLGVLLCVSTSAIAQESIGPDVCASMLEMVRSNYKSIETYDVLFKYERQKEAEGHNETVTRACRIASDPKNERFLIISTQERTDHGGQTRQLRSVAVLADKQSAWRTDYLSGMQQIKRNPLRQHLVDESIPNVFMIGGVSLFPSGSSFDENSERVAWDRMIAAIGTYGKTKVNGRTVAVEVETPPRKKPFGSTATKQDYLFDAELSLPLRHTCWYITQEGEKEYRKMRYKAIFEWSQHKDKNYLPEMVVIEEHGVQRRANGELVPAKDLTIAELHWFTVNGQIDKELWEREGFLDFGRAQELCQLPREKQ